MNANHTEEGIAYEWKPTDTWQRRSSPASSNLFSVLTAIYLKQHGLYSETVGPSSKFVFTGMKRSAPQFSGSLSTSIGPLHP
eukprot:5547374-Prymnesium_polylepis.1